MVVHQKSRFLLGSGSVHQWLLMVEHMCNGSAVKHLQPSTGIKGERTCFETFLFGSIDSSWQAGTLPLLAKTRRLPPHLSGPFPLQKQQQQQTQTNWNASDLSSADEYHDSLHAVVGSGRLVGGLSWCPSWASERHPLSGCRATPTHWTSRNLMMMVIMEKKAWWIVNTQ